MIYWGTSPDEVGPKAASFRASTTIGVDSPYFRETTSMEQSSQEERKPNFSSSSAVPRIVLAHVPNSHPSANEVIESHSIRS